MNVEKLKIVVAKVIRWNKQGLKENGPKWAVAIIEHAELELLKCAKTCLSKDSNNRTKPLSLVNKSKTQFPDTCIKHCIRGGNNAIWEMCHWIY